MIQKSAKISEDHDPKKVHSFFSLLHHVSEDLVLTKNNSLIALFEVSGLDHACLNDVDLEIANEDFHRALKVLGNEAGDIGLNLKIYTIRTHVNLPSENKEQNLLLLDLFNYESNLRSHWVTRHFISLEYFLGNNKLPSISAKKDKSLFEMRLNKSKDSFHLLLKQFQGSLKKYGLKSLKEYESDHGLICSEVGSFYKFLTDREWSEVVTHGQAIFPEFNLHIPRWSSQGALGVKVFKSNVGAWVGVPVVMRSYPTSFNSVYFERLQNLKAELTIVHSYNFVGSQEGKALARSKSKKMMQLDVAHYSSSGALQNAIEAIEVGEIVLGHHNFAVWTWVKEGGAFDETAEELNHCLGQVTSVLSDSGASVCREHVIGWEAQFRALFPHALIGARPRLLNSDAFVCMQPLFGGSKLSNSGHWGAPVAWFKGRDDAPVPFEWHDSDRGNSLILGPTGSGKTVFQGYLLAKHVARGVNTFFIDKDRGGEIAVRALGGLYHRLEEGEKTGFAPIKSFEKVSQIVEFVEKLISLTLRRNLQVEERQKIIFEVTEFIESAPESRSILSLSQGFSGELGDALYEWSSEGLKGWVFDNEEDIFSRSNVLLGFDTTELLRNEDIASMVCGYLFMKFESLLDGRPAAIIFDEFWNAISNPFMAEFIKDKLKVIRKQNGILVGGTQSLKDILDSPIQKELIEQCPTKIFFPNPAANEKDYLSFDLSEREFELVKKVLPGKRDFLLKKGTESAVLGFDLSSHPNAIKILSANKNTLNLMDKKLTNKRDPESWVYQFLKDIV